MKKIILCTLTIHLISLGCSNTREPEQIEPVQAPEKVRYVFVCEDNEGFPLTCDYDSDCCEDFVCVPDHSRGHRAKVCIYSK